MSNLRSLLSSLGDKKKSRTEATIQADIRQLILTAPLNLEPEDLEEIVLESPVGDRRRIDIEAGYTVIEVKRDLMKGKTEEDAIEQLRGYVSSRQKSTNQRFVGVLTDGAKWKCYHLVNEHLFPVSEIEVSATDPDIDSFLVWLEGVMGTSRDVLPTPDTIRVRLGVGSSSYALDKETLRHLYKANAEIPTVRMKRELWARLLTTALGTQFEDTDELFVEHTLLVNSAEIIAHAVLGFDVVQLEPATMLSGGKFEESGIYGVVESDFFDWVVEVQPEGTRFIQTLARRLSRFDWANVRHDILKVLYESVIPAETRKRLGEYYTPDWLAEGIVNTKLGNEIRTKTILDPACGSGTFLFHTIRRFLSEAEQADLAPEAQLSAVLASVKGIDLHPVAVALARVTYLLAVGRERLLNPNRGIIQVPVYLGDSLQWQRANADLWSNGQLLVRTTDQIELFESELKFPGEILKDSSLFEQLIQELADKATKRNPGSKAPDLKALFQRLGISDRIQNTLVETFKLLCHLHDEGRNHIWGYYVRNLARPFWLAQEENRVDILIGNPPWLAYRYMTAEMQSQFRSMSESRAIWQGRQLATHQDLSGLFVARSVQLYLKDQGMFAFVMPNAALDRAQFSGFRKGHFPDAEETVHLEFSEPWDLRRIRPHFFPRGASVVFGLRTKKAPKPMPSRALLWTGRLPDATEATWSQIEYTLEKVSDDLRVTDRFQASDYRSRFTQGAILAPRMAFIVEETPVGPLGVPFGKKPVKSHRGANEKKPWKNLPDLEGVVEDQFIRPIASGEGVVPFRVTSFLSGVIGYGSEGLLTSGNPALELYPGLSDWWKKAEAIWLEHRRSEKLTLKEQIDYHGKLSIQFPVPSHRIVYTKSGMHLAAARLSDRRAIVNNSLYWAAVPNEDEALFLCALLNSHCVTMAVRPLMSYGKDERHFDNYIWELGIPSFDEDNPEHLRIANLGRQAEEKIASMELDASRHFVALRRDIRAILASSTVGKEIEEAVSELLSLAL